jgi:hypothetical protein
MSSDSKKIDGLLNSIVGSLNKLDALDVSYKETKEQLTNEVASSVHQLAALSDSQAVRAQIIRDLYWNKRVSPTLISGAFGLKIGAMKRIAGALIVDTPCNRGCGNLIKKTYTSISNMENDSRWGRHTKGSLYSFHNVCEECQKREKAEMDAVSAQRKDAIRKRNEELRNMAWEDFIETEEWIAIRNRLIHHVDYKCEICQANKVGLNVYLHKDTPQDSPAFSFYGEGYIYFVLCKGCISRCNDLINEEKGEYIKREFFGEIMDWYNSR